MTHVACPHCGGTGKREVAGEYARTLAEVRRLDRPVTGAELGRLMGVKATAMNNRLARLAALGLLRSEWEGRRHLYSAVPNQTILNREQHSS